jgi:hypothetical protein
LVADAVEGTLRHVVRRHPRILAHAAISSLDVCTDWYGHPKGNVVVTVGEGRSETYAPGMAV